MASLPVSERWVEGVAEQQEEGGEWEERKEGRL